jgi:uncharacterized protein (DUF58 family)
MRGMTVTLEQLVKLRYLACELNNLQHKKLHTSQQGNYLSPFRGRGMDYAESRIYAPGDDIRTMDWRVTARTGKPHSKIYQQERERPIYLIVDFNTSMFFGTRVVFKSVLAAQAAAIIAWSAVKNGDRVGAVLPGKQQTVLSPRSKAHGIISLLNHLANHTNPHENNYADGLQQALKKILHIGKPGSIIYVVSDFYQLTKEACSVMQHLAKRFEVVNLFIYDPLEEQPPSADHYLFCGAINQGALMLNTSDAATCIHYRSIFQQRVQQLQQLSLDNGMTLLKLATNQDVTRIIKQLKSAIYK